RFLDPKFVVNWKTAAAGAVGIALIVGSVLWLRRDETDFSQTPTANQLPPESVAAPRLVGVGVNAGRTEIKPQEVLNLSLKAQYSDGSEKGLSNGIAWQSSDTTIASISPRGELEAFRAGTVQVVARTGGINSAPLNVVIKEPTSQPPIQNADTPSNISPSKPAGENMKIASYLNRAKDYRVQGNYGAALAELEKARATDPSNQEIRKEIEQTKRACSAEKRLGRPGLEC